MYIRKLHVILLSIYDLECFGMHVLVKQYKTEENVINIVSFLDFTFIS